MTRFTFALLLAGCVSTEIETNAGHPASPDAPTTNPPRSQALPERSDSDQAQPDTRPGGFTCSMHPQIHRSEPGRCPICGMQLVPVKP
jgi:hypothetical protein